MTEEEEFFAWLDGELPAPDAARVAARVAASSTLTAEAEAHRTMTAGLRAAFDPVMTAKSDVTDLASRRAGRDSRRPAGLPQWAAIAATLAIGIGLGTTISAGGKSGSPIALEDGRMIAAAALEQTLTTQLASAPQQGDATRIGLTFRNKQRRLCRTFSNRAINGLACRTEDDWQIEGLYGVSGPTVGDYRMAAGADPRLAALVDAMIVEEPLDALGEAAARQSGWR